jgi:hypothetical protein
MQTVARRPRVVVDVRLQILDKVGFKKLKLQMNKIGIGMKQKNNDTNYRCYNIIEY